LLGRDGLRLLALLLEPLNKGLKMLILPSNLQLLVGAVVVSAAFGAGWVVNDWRHDSIQLAAESAAYGAAEMTREQIALLATELESKIAALNKE
jgi:hypothetical protein